MIRKTLLATLSASILAGVVAASTPASATSSLYLGMPTARLGVINPLILPHARMAIPTTPSLPLVLRTPSVLPPSGWVCEPIYTTVPDYSHGVLTYRLVKDEDCHWVLPRNRTLLPFWPFGW
jgi:hypothetical protein